MKRAFFTAISITMIVILSGCSTTMMVTATDQQGRPIPGANVVVDGQHIGQTPGASTSVSNFIGTTQITVTADGYFPRNFVATREFKVAPFIGGLFLWPMWLWTWGPRAEQHVILTPMLPQTND